MAELLGILSRYPAETLGVFLLGIVLGPLGTDIFIRRR
jgi:hypothetical protein